MADQKEKSFFAAFFWSRAFFVVGLTVASVILFGLGRAYYQNYKVNQEIKSLEEEARGLEKKKIESMEILSHVMGNGFVEEKARTELNLKKDGEHVIVFSGIDDDVVESAQVPRPAPRQGYSNPIKWWYYFFSQHN